MWLIQGVYRAYRMLIYAVCKAYTRRIGYWYTAYKPHINAVFFVRRISRCQHSQKHKKTEHILSSQQQKSRCQHSHNVRRHTPYINVLYALCTLYLRRISMSYTPYARFTYAVCQCPLRLVYALHQSHKTTRTTQKSTTTPTIFGRPSVLLERVLCVVSVV